MCVRRFSRRSGSREVKLVEIRRFMVDSFIAVDVPDTEAQAQADLLIHADMVGHYSYGLSRLPWYIKQIKSGSTSPSAKPCLLNETDATAWVDGCNALGATVGNFCMNVAIKKALEAGAAWVSAKRCNHYGMSSYWSSKAEKKGLIGMSFTNSLPVMVPTRSRCRALGSNPLSLVAPAACGERLVVDMATTTIAMGKVEVMALNNEKMIEGLALGPDFKTTTDPKVALKAGHLLPLGGEEKTSGYKGYGLAAMVEIFCSGLSGSFTEHHTRQWDPSGDIGPPDLGQCFGAIDPGCFAPGFQDRVAECLNTWRNLDPVDPALPVLAPGDSEQITSEKTKAKGTISYCEKQLDALSKLAKEIGIEPLRTLKRPFHDF